MSGLRKAALVTLLLGTVLVLSGCWAKIHSWASGNWNYTLTKPIGDRIAIFCTYDHGEEGVGRSICAFDTILALCKGKPVKGISLAACREMTDYARWGEMDGAIRAVIGPQECMSFFTGPGGGGYWGALDLGRGSCE